MGANGSVAMIKSEARANALTAFEPSGLDEAIVLATKLVASGFLPKAITKPEAALAIIICGRELGLTAMQSLRSIHIIEGKPTLSADLMLALAKQSPECVYFTMLESTAKVARYETHRKGEPNPTTMSFTMEQAVAAGVTGKTNWKNYPDAMLRARCIAALARAVYPDLLMGIYDPDEIDGGAHSAPVDKRRPLAAAPAPVEAVQDAEVVETQPSPFAALDDDSLSIDELDAAWAKAFDSAACTADLAALRNHFKSRDRADGLEFRVSVHYEKAKARIKGGK